MKMGYRGFAALLGVSQALFGCGSDGGEGAPEGQPCGCGDKLPQTNGRSVAWDVKTPLGVTPAEAFAAVTGSCTAPLEWEHISEGSFSQVEPPTGSTDVTVEVAFYGTAGFVDCAHGSLQCTRSITAYARVTVTSADGAFADEGDVEVVYTSADVAPRIDLRVPGGVLGGSLTITSSEKHSESSLTYRVTAMGSACQGQLTLGHGRGVTSFDGELGSWSGSSM
jgi:hypothetical protein